MIEPTLFASAERQTSESIAHDRLLLAGIPHLETLLNAMPLYVMILNRDRQIVFANKPLEVFLKADEKVLLGHRPGEALRCAHAYERITGCGTTEFCRDCGAVQAILASHENRPEVRECRILLEGLDALDLRVWAVPLELQGTSFTLFSITDISAEKRRSVLERLCNHDFNNLLGILTLGIDTLPDHLQNTPAAHEHAKILESTTARLTEELRANQELNLAESCELRVEPLSQPGARVLKEICDTFADQGLEIVFRDESEGEHISTDPLLLGRIFTNILKNAREAASSGSPISVHCSLNKGYIRYAVHNEGQMSSEVQHQVFQRSFSTKGTGRGLGTYSMKLIAERYLSGRVWFESTGNAGTTFYLELPMTP